MPLFFCRCTVSIRDILSWVNFINLTSKTLHDDDSVQYNKLDPPLAFIHGACLVFLDGLGSGKLKKIVMTYNECIICSSLDIICSL